MMNYNQESNKIEFEGHLQIPPQPSYFSIQPPNSAFHNRIAPFPTSSYTFSQFANPSQQCYPSVHQKYQHPAYAPHQLAYMEPNFSQQGPVTIQPMRQADPNYWMQKPAVIENCPPGLEYLASIDELLVFQKMDILEMFTNFEMENKYSVHNSLGQMVYHATEKSGVCIRNCCGSARPFQMSISDNSGQEVIHISRPLKCQCWCCFCCLQTMDVSSPPGVVIGTIEQNWNPLFPSFLIKNSSRDDVLRIKGPFWTNAVCCCADIEFEVFYANGDKSIGKITKKWAGYVREVFSNADNFGISFPNDLDVNMKAVLLGALFLIDMMYFEKRRRIHT